MSRDFTAVPAHAYIGAPYSIPIQIAGKSGLCVPLQFNWLAYGASSLNQNICANVALTSSGGSVRATLLDQIRSIYIDNLGSAIPIYVQFLDTLFTVVAAPFTAGWYPVFTNSYFLRVVGLGFNNGSIPQSAIFVTNLVVPPDTDVEVQRTFLLASPVISTSGGGTLESVTINAQGTTYLGGVLSITGGGGAGAAAHGVVNRFGQFTAVVIDNAGNGYTGPPLITPTSGNTGFSPWQANTEYNPGAVVTYAGDLFECNIDTRLVSFAGPPFTGDPYWTQQFATGAPNTWQQINYNPGDTVVYQGFVWVCAQSTEIVTFVGDPIDNPSYWQFLAVASQQAVFSAVVEPLTGGAILSSGYGIEAMGDQSICYVDAPLALGIFRRNLFGTPYGSGFIYLTNIFVVQMNNIGNIDVITWELRNVNQDVLYAFVNLEVPGTLMDLQRMNVKLDATSEWQLVVTGGSAVGTAQMLHALTWTYSQI